MCSICCVFIITIVCVSGLSGPVVETSVGQIIGLQDEYIKFLGIPYGFVNVTDPFGPAKPHVPFETPYHAHTDPVICPQFIKGIPQGNIQCLHLNVYTPINKNQSRSLAVMVFIHGGEFKEGDGNFNTYSPKFLVRKDVIVVTVNYRLGLYGFLCLEREEYKNQGLKDQSLALKWVKKNIKNFGGDENNIMLFGHSAGSASTEFHLLYNKDKVFNKVILQSMQLVSPLMSGKPTSFEYLTNVAARVGLNRKYVNTSDVVKDLSNVRMDLLVALTYNYRFRPCIDSSVIEDHDLKDMKIIIGNAAKEAIFMYKNEVNFRNIIKKELNNEFDNIDEGIARAEKYYLTGNVEVGATDFGTDWFCNYPVERSVRHYLKNNATVYRYVFSYAGGRNFIKVRDSIDAEGATHGDELGYLFDPDIFNDTITEKDEFVIGSMTTFWTNFAKYGDPTPSESSTLSPWPEFNGSSLYVDIGPFLMVRKEYRKEQMTFWETFYHDFGVHARSYHYVGETEFNLMKNTVATLAVTRSLALLAYIIVISLS